MMQDKKVYGYQKGMTSEQMVFGTFRASQNKMILEALLAGRKITAIEALQAFGCFRLAARINNLRASGYQIQTGSHICANSGKRVAYYVLTDQK